LNGPDEALRSDASTVKLWSLPRAPAPRDICAALASALTATQLQSQQPYEQQAAKLDAAPTDESPTAMSSAIPKRVI
jgi:hypothetical protein